MALRAVKPQAIQKRLKLFLYGPPGVGKTTAALQFPSNYVIDLERGAENYAGLIEKSGSVLFQNSNPDDVKGELKSLLTEKHPYLTLTIDPVTVLYGTLQEKWNRVFEKYATSEKQAELQDYGFRYWARVKSDYKSIMRLLTQLDMNVIVTSHQKDIYGPNMQRLGVGPDSMKGDEYLFDYVFQLDRRGEIRIAKTIKQRIELGKQGFPPEFEWSYANFRTYYGAEAIERESKPVALASEAQVAEIKRLVSLVNVDDATTVAWFTKADVDHWEEMNAETIQKCIDFVRKKLEVVQGAK